MTVVLLTLFALPAWSNHDTDCTAAGGTNGPGQLDCSLPVLVAPFGSTQPQSTFFVYTPSTDQNPITCAVGAMTVNPPASWLSIDTTMLDATVGNMQNVEVTADPTGLGPGEYDGTVTIVLEAGTPPQCPSAGDLTGTVSVRLRVVETAPAIPALDGLGLGVLALLLIAMGVVLHRRGGRTVSG